MTRRAFNAGAAVPGRHTAARLPHRRVLRSRSALASRLARQVVASILLLWLSGLPAVRSLHVALAQHGHRYCDVHRQVEDVPLSPTAAPERDGSQTIISTLEHAEHSPCGVLGIDAPRAPVLVRSDTDAPLCAAAARPTRRWLALPHTPTEPLSLAPKNSPPRLAV